MIKTYRSFKRAQEVAHNRPIIQIRSKGERVYIVGDLDQATEIAVLSPGGLYRGWGRLGRIVELCNLAYASGGPDKRTVQALKGSDLMPWELTWHVYIKHSDDRRASLHCAGLNYGQALEAMRGIADSWLDPVVHGRDRKVERSPHQVLVYGRDRSWDVRVYMVPQIPVKVSK